MKKKLMMYMSSSILITLFVVTVLFISIVNLQYEINIKKQLKNNNELIINIIETNNIRDKSILFKHNFNKSYMRITYIDKKGMAVYDSVVDDETLINHNDRREVKKARINGQGYDLRVSKTTGKKTVYYASSLKDGTIIRSSMSLDVVRDFGNSYFKYYFILILFVFLVTIIFSNRLSYIIIQPIKDLDFTTSRIAKGELNRRVSVVSCDEIGQLAKNFNKMADKLEYTLNDSIDKQTRLEAILKSMDSGIIAIDRNSKIIMINPYAQNIFSAGNEVIGKNLLEGIRNYDIEKIFKSNSDEYFQIRTNRPLERTLRIKTADIINRSEHIGRVAVVQDITDIKKLENMRTEFVANVSHELKTPLTSIKGFAETLKDVEDAQIREKFLNIINDEAERLTRLISDILTLSDIEQIKGNKNEKINVNEVIRDVYNLMKNVADNKGIDISIIEEDIPCIYGDTDRFKQMIINLVDNAIKYSEKGDKVRIGTRRENLFLKLWVEDTGVGITKKHIPRLFERFYRVDKARSRSKGGTGLGLAIVKHIVLSMNGTIEVESEVNVGSKFIVTIPYKI